MPLVDAKFKVMFRARKCKLNPSLALFSNGQKPKGTPPLAFDQYDGFWSKYKFHDHFQEISAKDRDLISDNANIIVTYQQNRYRFEYNSRCSQHPQVTGLRLLKTAKSGFLGTLKGNR